MGNVDNESSLKQDVAFDPFPALAGSSISLTGTLDWLSNPNGSILNKRRLGRIEIASVALTAQTNWVLWLMTQLLASCQVRIELLN